MQILCLSNENLDSRIRSYVREANQNLRENSGSSFDLQIQATKDPMLEVCRHSHFSTVISKHFTRKREEH